MTVHIDWTTVDQPTLRLTLEQEGPNFIVVDQRDGDTVYYRSGLDSCVRFMLAAQAKKDAVIDEDAILWFRLLRLSGLHSVRVPSNVVELRPENAA